MLSNILKGGLEVFCLNERKHNLKEQGVSLNLKHHNNNNNNNNNNNSKKKKDLKIRKILTNHMKIK